MADDSEVGLSECLTPEEILEEGVERWSVPPATAEFAQERYEAFFRDAASTERSAVRHALEQTTLRETKLAAAEGDEGVSILQEELKRAHVEAAVAVQREESLSEEIRELKEEKLSAEFCLENEKAARREELRPVVSQLRCEVEEFLGDVAKEKERAAKAAADLRELQSTLLSRQTLAMELQKERDEETVRLNRVKNEPLNKQRQNDAIENVLSTVQRRSAEQGEVLAGREADLACLQERLRDVEMEKAQAQSTTEQGRIATEARREALGDIQKDVDAALAEHRQHLADRVQIDLFAQEKENELKRTKAQRQKAQKEKDEERIRLTEFQKILDDVKAQEAALQMAVGKFKGERGVAAKRLEKAKAERETARREEDVVTSEFLKVESEEGSVEALVKQTLERNVLLETEIEEHRALEGAKLQMLTALLKQRDNLQRRLSTLSRTQKKKEAEVEVRDGELKDLTKLHEEKVTQRAEFQNLYDVVKNERNRCVHHIQRTRQGTQEFQSQLALLEKERDCQREMHEEKCKEIDAARAGYLAAIEERDALKAEASALRQKWLEKMECVEKETFRLESCLSTIRQSEREMATVKRSFEHLLQNRNFTGLLLIDRNDELALLYEKTTLHENVKKQGEMELKRREEEIRMLRLKLKEAEHSIQAAQKTRAQIAGIDEEIAWLRCQLLDAKKAVEERSRELETPDNAERFRKLDGTDPEPEQLEIQAAELHRAVAAKEAQSMERDLLLAEVLQLNANAQTRLRQDSATGMQLGRDLVKYALRNDDLLVKLKSAAAERSVYKALAHEMAQERETLRDVVASAQLRLAVDAAPTDKIARQWEQTVRQDAARTEPEGRPRPEPRPNAYIPEDLGIPRPFGVGAFKPSPVGATMRHIKRPQRKDVSL